MIILLSILFFIICLLLIFMVVITPSNEGGMAAAFGGMGGDSFFGSKGQQHVNRFTVFLAVSFLALAMLYNYMHVGKTVDKSKGPVETKLEKTAPPAPVIPGAPAAPAGAPPK